MRRIRIYFRIIAERKDGKFLSGCSFNDSFLVNSSVATIDDILDEIKNRGKAICKKEDVTLRETEIISIKRIKK